MRLLVWFGFAFMGQTLVMVEEGVEDLWPSEPLGETQRCC